MVRKYILGILAISLAVNVILGFLFLSRDNSPTSPASSQAKNDYPYISPRVFVEETNDIIINFNPLRQALRSYVQNSGEEIQIYFEYLPSGSSIGVNDQEPFLAASLFKIPVAMAVMRSISEGKIDENKILTIEEKHIDKRFGNLWKKGAGAKLSVTEALEASLIESDNTATNLLKDAVPLESIADVLNTLDFPRLSKTDEESEVTVKNYSTILKSLYLSSYLRFEDSNQILDILTKTDFKDRLESGLPQGIAFAHKIGEYEGKTPDSTVYSDCGIVYLPKKPYLLCVAVEGETKEFMHNVMKSVSQTIFGYVNDVERKN